MIFVEQIRGHYLFDLQGGCDRIFIQIWMSVFNSNKNIMVKLENDKISWFLCY